MIKGISLPHGRRRIQAVPVALGLVLVAGCSHSAATDSGTASAAGQAVTRGQRLATLQKQLQAVQANPNYPPQMKQATIAELNREISQLSSK